MFNKMKRISVSWLKIPLSLLEKVNSYSAGGGREEL